MKYGGDEQPDDMPEVTGENEADGGEKPAPKEEATDVKTEGGEAAEAEGAPPDGKEKEEVVDDGVEEEDEDELELKLALLEIYNERYDKRMEAKSFIFDRGLVADYRKVRKAVTFVLLEGMLTRGSKKIVATDRKREKAERDLVARVRVFGNIQTAVDQEVFTDGLVCSYLSYDLLRDVLILMDFRRAYTAAADSRASRVQACRYHDFCGSGQIRKRKSSTGTYLFGFSRECLLTSKYRFRLAITTATRFSHTIERLAKTAHRA
jgi:hypothetical protein